MALNKIKNGSGKTKYEATAIIQIMKHKGLQYSNCNYEDLRSTDEAELTEMTDYMWRQ